MCMLASARRLNPWLEFSQGQTLLRSPNKSEMWPNAGLMLGRRRRLALGQHLVFVGFGSTPPPPRVYTPLHTLYNLDFGQSHSRKSWVSQTHLSSLLTRTSDICWRVNVCLRHWAFLESMLHPKWLVVFADHCIFFACQFHSRMWMIVFNFFFRLNYSYCKTCEDEHFFIKEYTILK